MKVGDRVRMTEELKADLKKIGCQKHVDEFGACEGVIVGRSDDHAPIAWDIRWQPSNLRYAYLEDYLKPA